MIESVVDILISNGTVLTMNAAGNIIPNAAVAIKGDRIVAVGPMKDFAVCRASRTIDAQGGIILPGLVNTHTHAAMTCFRGLADDLPLMAWLNDHIFPAEARLTPEMVYAGTLLACAEMILSGTTCFCDMYLFEAQVARAAKEAKIRAVVGEVLYDFPSPSYGPLEKGFEYTEALMDAHRNDPLITIAVEPHSTYLCAPALLQKAADLALRRHAPLVIHLSETQSELETIQQRYGKSPVAHLADLGVLSPGLVACHCVALSDSDIELIRRHDVKVSHNPESNMKLASGIAPVPGLMQKGICVGLGTDGCASNNNLDMFLEMDTAAKLHKVATLDPTVMSAPAALRMATIDGARCLGLDKKIGSLEPGKLADLIIIDTAKPHLTPMYDPISHLVYAVNGADVQTVLINGRIVMENRRLLTLDVDALLKTMRDIARSIAGA